MPLAGRAAVDQSGRARPHLPAFEVELAPAAVFELARVAEIVEMIVEELAQAIKRGCHVCIMLPLRTRVSRPHL